MRSPSKPLPFIPANIQPPKGWRFLAGHERCREGDYWFQRHVTAVCYDCIGDEDEYGWEPINHTWYSTCDGHKPVRLKDTKMQYWIRKIE